MATPQAEALIAYVGGIVGTDGALAESAYEQASALVAEYVGTDALATIPAAILDGAILEVGSKLWARRNAPMGTIQVDTIDGTPIPTPRDPMTTVYPVLDRFLPGGFA